MSALSEWFHNYSLFESDPDYRSMDDEINDMMDGRNCGEDYHRECDPEYRDSCWCEPD
jgi:hypothetical protein